MTDATVPAYRVVAYAPGMRDVAAEIERLHHEYYEPAWGFTPALARGVGEGVARKLATFDPSRDGLWLVLHGERIAGAVGVAPDQRDARHARLQHFILEERARGRGLGRALVARALAFVRRAGYERASLTTFAGLEAACKLYEEAGFVVVDDAIRHDWGPPVRALEYELVLRATNAPGKRSVPS